MAGNVDDEVSGQRHDRSVLVLYGSETGNSQDIAEELGEMAERQHFMTRVSEMDLPDISVLLQYTVVVFVISTTGQGEFPRNARKFWRKLLRKRLPADYLSHVSFTTFGLGDSSYPKYNFTARKLHKRLEQLGAKEIYPRGEADEQDDDGIDGAFLPWKIDFNKHLLSTYPLPEGLSPIPPDVLLPAKYYLQISDRSVNVESRQFSGTNHGSKNDITIASPLQNERHMPSATSTPLRDGSVGNGPEKPSTHDTTPRKLAHLPVPGAVNVDLVQNKRVTPQEHWQDVRELTFICAEEIDYQPGAIMEIYPKNFPKDVQALINLMKWNEVADATVNMVERQSNHSNGVSHIPPNLHLLPNGTLRDLLTHNLDITAVPSRRFIEKMIPFTTDESHKERLQELIDPIYRDELYDYTSRPRRSILEVLQEFDSVQFPYTDAASIFPLITPRKFSIASGGELKKDPQSGRTRVQLLVAIVKYQTVIRKIRYGLASRYIDSLPEHTNLAITFSDNPSFYKEAFRKPQAPNIMVAGGTGIAPLRSLIWERIQQAKDYPNIDFGQTYLFYGCRNASADFFYENEWRQHGFKVFPAFSREQKHKVYVQDVIKQQKHLLHDVVFGRDGAQIYVCGSSGKMPEAVREAFIEVIMVNDEFKGDSTAAAKKLEEWVSSGNYIQETW